VCPPVRAHWRHLANMRELVLPSAHASPQPKQQVDRFSHFCTAHSRVSSGMPGHVLFPNNCPFALGIWAPSNICSLGSPYPITQTASRSVQPLLHSSRQSVVGHVAPLKITPSHGDLYRHVIRGSLGPPNSASQMASRLVQPFFAQMTAECPYTVQWDAPFPLKIAHSHGDVDSHLIHGSLSPPESSTQTASQSVQPFLQGSLL